MAEVVEEVDYQDVARVRGNPLRGAWRRGVWSGKDKLDFLLRTLKRIAARIPLEVRSPGWNVCAPYCNRALCT